MNTPFNPDNYLNADELACYQSKGDAAAVCAPDTVFQGRAYWSCDTAKMLFAAQMSAIRQAFGHQGTYEAEQAPDPLNDSGVLRLRLQEGRWDSRPVDDEGGDHGMNLKGWA